MYKHERLRFKREIEAIWARADAEGRPTTPAENQRVEQILAVLEGKGSPSALLDGGGAYERGVGGDYGSPGDVFIKSQGFKSIQDPGSRPQKFSTGAIEVGRMVGGNLVSTKGTLLEGSGSAPGPGGALVPLAQVIPGVVEKLFQSLTLEQLLSAGVATTNTISYANEGTATSAAAGVAEGGTKPESTLALSLLSEPVKKVATSLTVSDELLDDAPGVQSFINSRLSLFVRIESERQLLRGTAGGNEVQGLLTSRGVPVYAGGTAAGSKAEQIFKALNGVRGSAYVEPEWVVLNPADWQDIRLAKDSAGQGRPRGDTGRAMSKESVTTVREFLDAAIRRDYEATLAAIHPEVEWHSPPDIPNPEVAHGRDEYMAVWRDWVDAWDDYRWTPDEFLEGPGETVIVSGVESARGRDSGIDVLSRRVTGVFEVRDRKIVRFKAYLDRHEALEAAGLRE